MPRATTGPSAGTARSSARIVGAHHPIFLFRHGETVWNAEKRAQGHLDSPLTAAGRAQARIMGEGLARETLVLAAEAAGLRHDEACFDHRLREMSWGDWDGLNGHEIEARWPGEMAARRQEKWTYCPPNGENYIMASERAQAALDD